VYLSNVSGALFHFDGASWNQELQLEGSLCQVWGRGDSVWAIGGDLGQGEVYVRRGDTGWKPEVIEPWPDQDDSDDEAQRPCPIAMWGGETGPVYAIEYDGGSILERDEDTGTWRLVTDGGPILNAIWGFNSACVFAAGDNGHVLRFEGSEWLPLRDAGHTYKRVVIDPHGAVYVTDGTGIYRSGNVWTQMFKLGPDDGGIDDIWVGDDNEIFAVGACSGKGFILHFDGADWSRTPMARLMSAIAGSSRHDLYAAGFDGLYRHEDGMWSLVNRDVGCKLDVDEQTCLWALSSGSEGIIRFGHHGPETFLFAGNEQSRSALPEIFSSSSIVLYGLAALGAKDVIAVGAGGIVGRWNGKDWAVTKVSDETLYCVWARSADDIYVGGGNGAALHWNGSEWRDMKPGTNSAFFDIHGDDEGVWFAADGELLRYRG
jgi:hypothetical protein